MKAILGGVVVGLLAAGVIAAAIVPLLPRNARGPLAVWAIAGAAVAAAIYVVRRATRTPPR